MEDDDFVYSVQELRPEHPLHLVHDPVLHTVISALIFALALC
jgi:hypothetical protein